MLISARILLALGAAVRLLEGATPFDAAAVDRGRKEFIQSCGFCHGNDASGSRAPDLIRSALVNHDENGETVGPVIRSGRVDKGMPGFPNANVGDIAAFLHAQVAAALRSNSVPRDYPVEKLLTGNAEAGKAFFNGADCHTCHSPEGDLRGVASKYKPIDLQSRFLYPRGARASAVVTLPSGEHVSGKIEHVDEFALALRDEKGAYRSFSRASATVVIKDPLEAHRKLLGQYTNNDVHNLFAYLETLK